MQAIAEKETKKLTPTSFNYLMDHQKAGLILAQLHNRWGFFYDTGTGKTLLALSIYQMLQVKTLVICPLSIINSAWMEDISKWTPGLLPHTANLWELWRKRKNNNGEFRYKLNLDQCRLALVNYEGFKGQIQHIWNAGFKCVFLDESSKIKSPKATVTKQIIKWTETVPYAYLFSGTPAPNHPSEYYTQARIISKEIFGRSFYAFRNNYFYPTGYGGYKWIMKLNMKNQFYEKLAEISSVVRKEDVLDLPERTFNIHEVTLNSLEIQAYKKMKKDLLYEFEDVEFVAVNSAVKIMKLRQITSGFLMGENTIVELGKSKLNELEALLEEIGDHQVIIWTQFHREAEQICKLLDSKPIGRVDGTIPQQIKDLNIEEFKRGTFQILVAHPKSLGHGHTLTNCTYMIYYSLSYSLEEHLQSLDRNYRKGQTKGVSNYFLLAKDSIDKIIYKALQAKKDVANEAFNYITGRNPEKDNKICMNDAIKTAINIFK